MSTRDTAAREAKDILTDLKLSLDAVLAALAVVILNLVVLRHLLNKLARKCRVLRRKEERGPMLSFTVRWRNSSQFKVGPITLQVSS